MSEVRAGVLAVRADRILVGSFPKRKLSALQVSLRRHARKDEERRVCALECRECPSVLSHGELSWIGTAHCPSSFQHMQRHSCPNAATSPLRASPRGASVSEGLQPLPSSIRTEVFVIYRRCLSPFCQRLVLARAHYASPMRIRAVGTSPTAVQARTSRRLARVRNSTENQEDMQPP